VRPRSPFPSTCGPRFGGATRVAASTADHRNGGVRPHHPVERGRLKRGPQPRTPLSRATGARERGSGYSASAISDAYQARGDGPRSSLSRLAAAQSSGSGTTPAPVRPGSPSMRSLASLDVLERGAEWAAGLGLRSCEDGAVLPSRSSLNSSVDWNYVIVHLLSGRVRPDRTSAGAILRRSV
jgi:hypothetical protein